MNNVQNSANASPASAQRHSLTGIESFDRLDSIPPACESSRAFSSLPWWIEEKFHWTEGPAGRLRLTPLPEFLRAVEQDAPKLVDYGRGLLRPQAGSTEASIADALQQELASVLQSLSALDDREARALHRFLVDRATRNAVYAATTQYEIDRWVAKSAARGQDASEHDNFAPKESRRDGFATVAAVYAELVSGLMPDRKLMQEQYSKTARQVLFQQADIASREQLSPHQEAARDAHAVKAAVLASRPI
jgi:hypothetical protein